MYCAIAYKTYKTKNANFHLEFISKLAKQPKNLKMNNTKISLIGLIISCTFLMQVLKTSQWKWRSCAWQPHDSYLSLLPSQLSPLPLLGFPFLTGRLSREWRALPTIHVEGVLPLRCFYMHQLFGSLNLKYISQLLWCLCAYEVSSALRPPIFSL